MMQAQGDADRAWQLASDAAPVFEALGSVRELALARELLDRRT
jgi:hypothetical protein